VPVFPWREPLAVKKNESSCEFLVYFVKSAELKGNLFGRELYTEYRAGSISADVDFEHQIRRYRKPSVNRK